MNLSILNIENQEFINKNLNEDISDLLLTKHKDITTDIKLLAEQIEAKKRCKNKLPTWFNSPFILYPNKLNIEQTSSEFTAHYKANLIKTQGKTLIDITGGFAVDAYYFSKYFDSVTHCEISQELSEIVAHNFKQLQVDNISCVHSDGIAYLKKQKTTFDWIYIDPSRRHDAKGKVFFLNDCLPNVPKHFDLLFSKSDHILIKTSPLLDISAGINELDHVKSIFVLAVNNEVKELLWVLEKNYEAAIKITAVNLIKDKEETFCFDISKESSYDVNFSHPLTYLYEPNAAILKAGAFNSLASQFNLCKLHKHTHLYTSDTLFEFPGRKFKVENVIPYNKKKFKKTNIKKANITTRNFPETVKDIRKKLSIQDGGDIYLFFTTNPSNERIIIICKKQR
ncbi:SAM-dependent methyltransferase [Hanstruepera neustonica]|uniref:SAM-dependent methyltransferase n=1 Tax=Hanstruepera neustonica TaxID=1445657 RepID=A0A2K1DY74_9FLAO|nr:SAM-dependent methyltransferase [Hanstruepera neustonica]PNQ72972.1 SAM-dependent methyltransferase [Hanstruepera neustonica]